MTTKQAADALGISTRAMRNKQHLYKTKEVHTGKGRGGKTLYFWIDEKCSNILENTKGTKELLGEISKEPTKGTKEPEANKLINQSDKPTKGTKGTDGVTFSNSSQHAGNNTDTEMCHPTVTNGVTNQRNKGTNDKAFDIAGLDDSPEFIDIESAVTLEGVGRTAIVNRIQRNNWETVEKLSSSGSRKLYIPIRYFSPAVQAEWRRMQMERSCAGLPAVVVEEQKQFQALTQDQREKAIVRQKLVLAYREAVQWGKSKKFKVKQIDKKFVKEAPVEHHQLYATLGVDRISIQSIRNWDKKLRDSQDTVYPVCLADSRRQNSGRPAGEGKEILKREVQKIILERKYSKATDIYNELCANHPVMSYSRRTVFDLVRRAKKDNYGYGFVRGNNSKTMRNTRARIIRLNDTYPGQIYEVDGKAMNNLVISPFYAHDNAAYRYILRPVAIVVRDVATGMIVACILDASENFHACLTAWRIAISRFGIPERVISDNAGSLNNKHTNTYDWANRKKNTKATQEARLLLAQGFTGIYDMFGAAPHFSIPGNPQSKNIEPANALFDAFEQTHSIWTGRNKDERDEIFGTMTNMAVLKKYKDQLMLWDDYQRELAAFIEQYNRTPREVLKNMSGDTISPLDYWNQFDHRRADIAEVDTRLVLRFPVKCTVRMGAIKVHNMFYRHPEFGYLDGQTVYAYYDERHIHHIRIGSIEGQLFDEPAERVLASSWTDKEKFIAAAKQCHRAVREQKIRYVEHHEELFEDIEKLEQFSQFNLEQRISVLLGDQSESQEDEKQMRFDMESVYQAIVKQEDTEKINEEGEDNPFEEMSKIMNGNRRRIG